MNPTDPPRAWLPLALLAPGLLALALEPAVWLLRTWTDPAWDSNGWLPALVCLGLVARSLASGPAAHAPRGPRLVLGLLALTALVRLSGRLLAVHALGALALAVDAAALALALGLARRPWPVRPLGLAGLFALSLPLEELLQRALGFPLRLASAAAAHGLLAPLSPGLERHGSLLVQDGLSLAVDLPCSGAQGLWLLLSLAAAVACRRHPGPAGWQLLPAAAVLGAFLANTLRIAGVFVGLRLGWPILQEPWHSALGLGCLLLGAWPLVGLARRLPVVPRPALPSGLPTARAGSGRRTKLVAAGLFSALGLSVALAPARPLDISGPVAAPRLPHALGTEVGQDAPLSEVERRYFTRFGGQAVKRTYTLPGGLHTLVAVRTASPLRHLHGPDRCLLGAGHRVERLGVRLQDGRPSEGWRSTAPDGRSFRVEAWYLGPDGQHAAGLSEVAWRWLTRGGGAWTLVERISPWSACEAAPGACLERDAAVLAALELEPEVNP